VNSIYQLAAGFHCSRRISFGFSVTSNYPLVNMEEQTQTVTETAPILLRAKGVKADINRYASLDKFAQASEDEDYNKAVSLIRSKLDKISPVKALFVVNLGSNQAELLIDARSGGQASMSRYSSQPASEEGLLTKVYVRPTSIERFVDGVMDARYAQTFGHVFIDGSNRVGIKFIDGLTPFRNVHPTLDRTSLTKLPKPTEELRQAHQDLKDWGYCLIKDALTPGELQKLQVRLRDQARAEAEAGIGFFDGGEGKPNQRLWCLHNKGQEFIDLLDSNRVIKEFVPKFLGDDAILFSYTANIARPGSSPMYLHNDQLAVSVHGLRIAQRWLLTSSRSNHRSVMWRLVSISCSSSATVSTEEIDTLPVLLTDGL
jgi:hypothetical protein